MYRKLSRFIWLLIAVLLPINLVSAAESLIDWRDWSPAVFDEARRDSRLVLLNLEAVWCHWCHVMDQKTYSNVDVAALIADRYVAVKVDHDARPDLANRYRRYGWPATIILAADGTDLVKRAGYISADRFIALLEQTADDPVPEKQRAPSEPEFSTSHLLDADLRARLERRRESSFDRELGGLRSKKKSMDRDGTEYSMLLAANGDSVAERMARLTIDNSLALIDPAWGGVYQYSTHGDWQHPHYEKIMATQAGYLRIYALAYLQWGDERYLDAARAIERYLDTFLTSPDGAYYTSQDADLVQGEKAHDFFRLSAEKRHAAGMPRVDTHVYSRENGWAIEAVATLYRVTGEQAYLDKARRAAEWIIENRSLPGGGFRHDETDAGGPYLSDTLNMARAFLELYRATGERRWLSAAVGAAEFMNATFRAKGAGYVSGAFGSGPLEPLQHIDENVSATRFFNLIYHHTGDMNWRDAAEHGMRYLATPSVATRRIEESGILLADFELGNDPAHFTVVASKDDRVAEELYDVTRRQPGWYVRAEWWDRSEGPMPNPDVRYPELGRPAAFVCTLGRCSVPAYDAEKYRELITRITGSSR